MPYSNTAHQESVNAIKFATNSLSLSKGLNNAREAEMRAAIISAAFYGNFSDTDPSIAEPAYYDNVDFEGYFRIIRDMCSFVAGESALTFSNSEENTIASRISNIVLTGQP